MISLWRIAVTALAAAVSAAGAADVLARASNAATAAAGVAPAGPTQRALLSRETQAYEAWKSRDARFWQSFLADQFVGWGSSGRLDKAAAAREYTGADCKVASYAISDAQMTPLGQGVSLITHKITVDGACGAERIPPASWVATVYVRAGNQWQAAFHAAAAIVDPAAPAGKTVTGKAGSEHEQDRSVGRNARTAALLAQERALWDAWKDHDVKRLDGLTATNMQFINIFGAHFATKPAALQNWSGRGCEVRSVDLTNAALTMLSPTVGILTFHASADGTCLGQKVGPIRGSSIYVKDGDTWRWTFGINLPAP